ncbi:MAG TPA: ABC transporter permease [Lachnospiraceae bacterium]|nr:ABC transporter permease [Lachnospiraceae bacterium]
MKLLKEIWDYRTMITSLVHRDLRGRYKGSVLGFFWTFLNPLLQLIVYTLVFSVIMRAGIEDYYLFLFVALVPWVYFSTSAVGGAGCIIGQQNLVNKIYFPREVLPISHVLSQLINMLLSMVVVIAVLLVSGKGINLAVWWYFPIIVLQETLLAFGLVLLISSVTVYFRDLQFIINIFMMAWQFLTPVMYSVDMVPERLRPIFYLNPMTPIIVAYRDVLYYKQAPELNTFLTGTVMGLVMLIIGWISFTHLKRHFAEVM